MGRLGGWKSWMNQGKKPCVSYKSKDGRRRFHGTRHLKGTEILAADWEGGGVACGDTHTHPK